MPQSWWKHSTRRTQGHHGEFDASHKTSRGRSYLEGGVMSGDDPLTHDLFPHKRDGRAIRFPHSRRLSSPEGLRDRFLAML
jgi:hypothetical protein